MCGYTAVEAVLWNSPSYPQGWISVWAVAYSPDTYPACLHITSNQQQPKNQTTYVVISTVVVSS